MSLFVEIEKQLGSFLLDVRLSVKDGESPTALLGASGCGKSLTLKSIAGIVRPDRGRIVLNGRVLFDSEKRIDLPPQKRRVGYLFQNYALFPNMTVEQNIACGLFRQKDRAKRSRAVSDMIKVMRLTGLEGLKPYQLSGGQQQRTALARILVGEPELLMLDEPFSALDSFLTEQLRTELAAILQDFNKDTLLVTHSRDEAYELCKTLAVMDGGRIIRNDETHAVFRDPKSRSAAILTGCKNIVDARKTGETRVVIPSWGVELETAQPVGEGLCAIGVRAHSFSQAAGQNRFEIRAVQTTEGPFEWNVRFRTAAQKDDAPAILQKLPKEAGLPQTTNRIGVDPQDILLLYE